MSVPIGIVGAGAAGLMAAGAAAQQGCPVVVFEKNSQAAKKVRISGKGRCNITNAAPLDSFVNQYPGNGDFLYGVFHRFGNHDVREFFDRLGVPTKVERGGRVFPVSDDANCVADALEGWARSSGALIRFDTEIRSLADWNADRREVKTKSSERILLSALLVCTGGMSYPKTGSSGDGYRLARQAGHSLVPPRPALVPLRTDAEWTASVAGLTLRNVEITVRYGESSLREFGEMEFLPGGVGGPIVLTVSRQVVQWFDEGAGAVELAIDLKPALAREQLDQRLCRDLQKYSRKQFKNGLSDLLPRDLVPVIVALSGIPEDKPVHQITRSERYRLLHLLKALPLSLVGSYPMDAALVTSGGVNVKEINPKTMESRRLTGLYFAGEVLDVDGVTGGYNLQAAFSTGYAAGTMAANEYGFGGD